MAEDLPVLLFYEEGCPHCGKVNDFLETRVVDFYPVEIVELEIHEADNARKMIQLARAYGAQAIIEHGTPATFIADQAIQGDGEQDLRRIEEAIRANIYTDCVSPLKRLEELPEYHARDLRRELTIPSLIGAAIVDAVNPCAFAVLTLMLGSLLLVSKRHRVRRIIMSGLAFTAAVFICYVLMGLGLFGALRLSGLQDAIYLVAGILAVLVGIWNLKDAFMPGMLPNIEVPKAWHGRIEKISTAVTSPTGAFIAGGLVSWILLPCTSGPYIVVLGMLGDSSSQSEALGLILLYNLIFVLPFPAITLALAFGLARPWQIETWRRKHKGKLHFATGIFMLLLGLLLLFLK